MRYKEELQQKNDSAKLAVLDWGNKPKVRSTDLEDNLEEKPEDKSEVKQEDNLEAKSENKPEAKQEDNLENKPEDKSEAKKEDNLETKSKPARLFGDSKAFNKNKAFKLGIIGGKDVGKSYLFKAMTYRLKNSSKAGALSYFIKDFDIELSSTTDRSIPGTLLEFDKYIEEYLKWEQLAPTKIATQRWYRLSIPYRTGIFSHKKAILDVEFFDGAGEVFADFKYSESAKKHWLENYRDAKVMIFCLPLWVAFPKPEHVNSPERRKILSDFNTIITTYQGMRKTEHLSTPLKSILALTMSDDTTKTSLGDSLVDTWFKPYAEDNPDNTYFEKLRSGGAINRYLANARQVSNLLHQEFLKTDVLTAPIPRNLTFGKGMPWIIPVSAINGKYLDRAAELSEDDNNEKLEYLPLPNPAHVELPLLVALCEHTNALM